MLSYTSKLMQLPKIYPITDRKLSGLSHAEQVKQLIDGGAKLIQLREKHLPPIEFLHEAEDAQTVALRHSVTLIINDRVDIAMAVGAGGIHLGQHDLPIAAARRLARESTVIGFSTHTLPQLEAAVAMPVNYVAFGPIFATRSKKDPDAITGLAQLRAAKAIASDVPLVAIGGITLADVRAVLEAGADSVALISAVVGDKGNIAQNMRRLLDLVGD